MELVGSLAFLVFWFLVLGGIGQAIAKRRGLRSVHGWIIGGLLGPIGWIILLLIPPSAKDTERKNRSDGMKKCPQCAEWVKRGAKVCRYCGYSGRSVASGGTPAE